MMIMMIMYDGDDDSDDDGDGDCKKVGRQYLFCQQCNMKTFLDCFPSIVLRKVHQFAVVPGDFSCSMLAATGW